MADRGTWEPDGDAGADLDAGSLGFRLHGEKLMGGWRLVRMRAEPRERRASRLLIKAKDAAARSRAAPDVLIERPLSVVSGRAIADIGTAR